MNFAPCPARSRTFIGTCFRKLVIRRLFLFALLVTAIFTPTTSFAQENSANSDKDFYARIKSFTLGSSAAVNGLVLNRDRVQMTFHRYVLLCCSGCWPRHRCCVHRRRQV